MVENGSSGPCSMGDDSHPYTPFMLWHAATPVLDPGPRGHRQQRQSPTHPTTPPNPAAWPVSARVLARRDGAAHRGGAIPSQAKSKLEIAQSEQDVSPFSKESDMTYS